MYICTIVYYLHFVKFRIIHSHTTQELHLEIRTLNHTLKESGFHMIRSGYIRYSNCYHAKKSLNSTNLISTIPLNLKSKIQSKKRKRRQREKNGAKCGFYWYHRIQRISSRQLSRTSVLWLNSSRKTTRTPDFVFPTFLYRESFKFAVWWSKRYLSIN
jgi:hypothetical protein